jgi:hypothetical protein
MLSFLKKKTIDISNLDENSISDQIEKDNQIKQQQQQEEKQKHDTEYAEILSKKIIGKYVEKIVPNIMIPTILFTNRKYKIKISNNKGKSRIYKQVNYNVGNQLKILGTTDKIVESCNNVYRKNNFIILRDQYHIIIKVFEEPKTFIENKAFSINVSENIYPICRASDHDATPLYNKSYVNPIRLFR